MTDTDGTRTPRRRGRISLQRVRWVLSGVLMLVGLIGGALRACGVDL